MRLIHYSPEPLTELADPHLLPQTRVGKPTRGLWVSVEAQPFGPNDKDWGWRQWCEAERFQMDRLTHATEIILKPDANPLWLKTAESVEALAKEYPNPTGYIRIQNRNRYVSELDAVDWDAIMANWPAIIIAPYQWACRMDVLWYYCWDCASGVIWDTSIIKELRPIPEFARPKEEAA